MEIKRYTRKPFDVDAVQVTDTNMNEVAEWCGGTMKQLTTEPYIKVGVYRPLNKRQTEAYVGDWVLFANNGFKVYTQKAFDKCFVPVPDGEMYHHDFRPWLTQLISETEKYGSGIPLEFRDKAVMVTPPREESPSDVAHLQVLGNGDMLATKNDGTRLINYFNLISEHNEWVEITEEQYQKALEVTKSESEKIKEKIEDKIETMDESIERFK